MFVAAQIAAGIAGAPKIPLSPVMCAVVLGMLVRNTVGVPAWSQSGLNWTMKVLLRIGVALVGLRLTLQGASAVAAIALPVAATCITVALLGSAILMRVFGTPKKLAALLAVGTAVCGATAVIAVAPVIRARNEETAFAVACVVLFGCIAMLTYPWVAGHFFSGSPVTAGIFLGTAIHDTSQVVGAGLIYSQQAHAPDALAAASVTKLLRNLSMAVLIPAAAWWASRQPEAAGERSTKTEIVPFFVIAFLLCIVLRTVGDTLFGHSEVMAPLWRQTINATEKTSEILLICALAAVGMSVSFKQMWRIGWRPLLSAFVMAILVGATSLGLILFFKL